jgi:hypothetical protein
MDAQHFQELPIARKIRWIYFQGTFLMSIRYYEYKVNLYLVGDFLVESFYHHTNGTIDKVDLMDYKSTRLKFYQDQIQLPADLLNSL